MSKAEKYTEPINGSELVTVVIGDRTVERKAYAAIERLTKTRFTE